MASISVYGYDPEMLDSFRALETRENGGPSSSEALESCSYRKEPTKFRFLELPYELRHQIYRHVMPATSPSGIWYRATAPIWATCSFIHEECISMLYSNCIFHVHVGYEGIEFPFAYLNTKSTFASRPMNHRRKLRFPDVIPLRYRHLLRRIFVLVTHIDEYDAMVKYNCSNTHALTVGVREQVEKLCYFLQPLPEIRELTIKYHQWQAGNSDTMRLILEPFRALRNTKTVSVLDLMSVNKGFEMQLQAQLANAYTRNSFSRLPPEVRLKIYGHLMPKYIPFKLDGNEKRIWLPGDLTIVRTCRSIYNEADHELYDLALSVTVRA